MKKIIFYLSTVLCSLRFLTVITFAKGENSTDIAFLTIDANFLMGNFYKIVLIVVAIGCIAGLIYSNIKSKKK